MDLGVHQKTLIDRAYGGERPPLPPLRKYLIHVTCQAFAYVVGVAGWANSESVGIEPFSANVAVDGNMVNLGLWDTAGFFPSILLSATISPITRIVLKDSENDHIYHSELFTLTKRAAKGEPQKLSFTVPIFEPHPPQYYIHVVSDSWLQSEAFYTISFKNLALPESHTAHTELLDLKPLPVTENGFSLEEDLDAPPGQRYKMKVVPTSKNITFGVAEEACSKIRKSKIGGTVSYGTMVMIHMSYSSIPVCMLVTVFLLVLKLADIAPLGYGFCILIA
ncbi:unnamed protein product [Lactuca virosa]|uniref:SEC63 domain-containing protein n=1 Tax=Lactuca virosa TaxID=75947 RepID=A0AAU9MHR2_9ASTR|nr:unnamed protein product [Lactuca virosa]